MDHFSNLKSISNASKESIEDYCIALTELKEEFTQRFGSLKMLDADAKIFNNPFIVELEEISTEYQLEVAELQCDDEMKFIHKKLNRAEFYEKLDRAKYPNLHKLAIRMMSMFGSTYTCEQLFSKMNLVKNKKRSRISDKHLRAQLKIADSNIDSIETLWLAKI